jgi:hypothetical protein
MKVSAGIDRLIQWLKWPLAIVSLVFLPGVAYALTYVVREIVRRPSPVVPLLVGAGGFLAVWLLILRPRRSLHFLVTIEHELTHALVAGLTLHRVSGLGLALRSGGHARYEGRGNWWIAIAPFLVPTFSLLVVAASVWLHEHRILGGLLGFTLAWNVVGNWSSTHRHHGDHREVGPIAAFLIVACANMLVLGLLLAYATQARTITGHLAHVAGPTSAFFGWLVKLFS